MYSTVASLRLPPLTSDARRQLLSQESLPSLYGVFAILPDPRRKEGQRYELAYRKVIKILRTLGFVFRRATGGSHEIWWHEQKRKTCVVPHHKEIKAGTLRSILRQAAISEETFLAAAYI